MHYNQEPNPFYSLDKVLEVFKRNNVTGVLATSRPNKGTHQLMDAKAPGLWVVPFIRPYRIRADIGTWFCDPTIVDLIKDEYKRGYYRGIGEFHISGNAAAGAQVKQIVDFAVERDLYLHCHCDETALLHLFAHNARAKIIWAHTGFSTAAGAGEGAAEEISGAVGRTVLSRRHHRRLPASSRRMARAADAPFRALPDRLRHLDQRALVRLRHDLPELSGLARAASRPRRRKTSPMATPSGCSAQGRSTRPSARYGRVFATSSGFNLRLTKIGVSCATGTQPLRIEA